ncbi:hypothetical protein DFA_06513 [Cavenderia fasciculata]|uniref:FNIP repeat-containing protein n=1 Tax=Cavenderia fasciculata TaxID=261658 RepID=F4PJ77_CACFS|nr:uncharacterized protein DFA_06513 [Cavenderia fasciculata]EGG24363.1 hypothetical protein DFA_06513 [Cavenderia fasciculata]|eukprot:XP_004362214.1 hypothetical protein DFA_06513 [Cavenderia fasciculata]
MYLSPFIESIINQIPDSSSSLDHNNKYDLSQLQTIIIEQIFGYIKDVVDVISLLLTCKKLLLLPFKSQQQQQQSLTSTNIIGNDIKAVFEKSISSFINTEYIYTQPLNYFNHQKSIQSRYNLNTFQHFFNASFDHRLVLDSDDPPHTLYKQQQQQQKHVDTSPPSPPLPHILPTITHSLLLSRLDSNRSIRKLDEFPKTTQTLWLPVGYDWGIDKSLFPNLQVLLVGGESQRVLRSLPDTLTSLTLYSEILPEHPIPRSIKYLTIMAKSPDSVSKNAAYPRDLSRTMFPSDSQLVELSIEAEVDLDVDYDNDYSSSSSSSNYFFPTSLTKLTLNIGQSIPKCFLTPNLKSLTIKTRSMVGFGQGLAGLHHLEFLDLVLINKSCRLEDLHLPSSLRVLKLKSYPRQQLWEGFLPPLLESLYLNFLRLFPSSLKTLDLQVNIQSQIHVGALPSSLTSLSLKYEQELVVGVIPNGLIKLELREHKHLINQQNVLPDSITSLSLPGYHQVDLSTFSFPPKLKKLELMNLKDKIILNQQDTDDGSGGHSRCCLPVTLEKWYSNIDVVGGLPIDQLPNLRGFKYPLALQETGFPLFSLQHTTTTTTTTMMPKQIKKSYYYITNRYWVDQRFSFRLQDVSNSVKVSKYMFDVRMLDDKHAIIMQGLYGGIVDLQQNL